MGQHSFPLPDFVIANAATESGVLRDYLDGDGFRDADSITIHAPDVLAETVTVQVADVAGGNFNPLSRGGADVTIPAGKSVTIELLSWKAMKLVAGVAVAAARTFKVTKSVWV